MRAGSCSTMSVGVHPRLRDDLLVLEQGEQPQAGAAAGLQRAEHVALPAQLEVQLGQREAVGGARRPRRGGSRAAVAAGISVTSRHTPGADPRPTRPRSWCSCDRPNRSASRITIAVAFGTSTPTSMTVVATSTSSSPRSNARITASFSSAGSLPCSTPEPQARELRPPPASASTSSTASGGRRSSGSASAASGRRRSSGVLGQLRVAAPAGTRRRPGARPRPPRAPAATRARTRRAAPPAARPWWRSATGPPGSSRSAETSRSP